MYGHMTTKKYRKKKKVVVLKKRLQASMVTNVEKMDGGKVRIDQRAKGISKWGRRVYNIRWLLGVQDLYGTTCRIRQYILCRKIIREMCKLSPPLDHFRFNIV
jgi:hypothetical protein